MVINDLTHTMVTSGQTLGIPIRSYHYLTGEEARLECQVQTRFDLDTPFNPWRKGSVDIDEDDRITVTVSRTRSVLHIRNLQSSDAGEYTCSKQGFSSTSVTITVETRPGMHDIARVDMILVIWEDSPSPNTQCTK